MYIDKINKRIKSLIEEGEKVLSTQQIHYDHDNPLQSFTSVNNARFQQWKASSLSFLSMVFSRNSTHFQEYMNNCKSPIQFQAETGLSILKSAKEDIEGGYLTRLEILVSADVFSDFLDMAHYLLEQGYKDPTASLVGAVLEDGLRKIAKKNNITVKNKETIVSLNTKLSDARVYNNLTQKMIQVWNDIRDNADHGKFSEYTICHVKDMLKGTANFLEQYLK